MLGFCVYEVALYFAFLYGMSFSQACASPFWFPDTVLLCALLASRPRNWWIYIVGAFPIRMCSPIAHDVPTWHLLASFANDSAKGLLLALALRRFLKNPVRLESMKDLGIFCAFAVLFLPAISALFGAAGFYALGGDYWSAWMQWFMGDAMTHVVLTPAILYWLFARPRNLKMPSGKRALEAVLVFVGLIVTGYIAFGDMVNGSDFAQVCSYAPVPLLFWAAIRFGLPGASGAIAVMTCFAVNAAIHSRGPFAGQSPADTAFTLQEFLLLRAAPLYLVAILIQQEQGVEDSLQESEARFRVMADTAPVMVWMSGADKLCDFFNRGWLDFTGRTMAQELGNGWAEGVHPDDLRRCVSIYHASFDARQSFEMEYRLRRYDGEYRWVLDRGVPRRATNGDFVGYIGVAIDLTDRKRAEEARQNLVHASRLAVMGEFTAMVAHELNQPLNAILNNAEAANLMLDVKVAPLDEIRKVLADIREDNLRAGGAIRRIRALVSKREMEMQTLNINETVSEVVRLARGDALRRNIQIHSHCHAPSPNVRGDAVHLQQVVLNLIVNGMDAMKDNPESERQLSVSTVDNVDGYVEVAVKDIGNGISPENLSRVFDSFFTTKPDGMGIGLSMARSIVQLHSGRLWAENNKDGRGTTFRFILPTIVTESPNLATGGRVNQHVKEKTRVF